MEALVDTLLVDTFVEVVFRNVAPAVQFLGRGQDAAVGGRCGDGPRVHQSDRGHLAVAGLGTFAVREVPGGVTDGEAVVGRGIARAEAGAAERGTDDGTGGHEVGDGAVPGEFDVDGLRGRVDGEGELAEAAALAAKGVGRFDDVRVVAARAAGDDALLNDDFAVDDLVGQSELGTSAGHFDRFLLDLGEDVLRVGLHFVDFKDVRRVERKGDHRLDAGEVDIDAAVIVSDVGRRQFPVVVSPAVLFEERFGVLIGLPDGGQAGGLGRHDVDTVAVVGAHGRDAGADELHDLVLDEAVLKDRTDDRQSDILRADERLRFAVEIDGHDTGVRDIVGVFEELFDELAAAFADGHGAEGTVTGVGVRAEDHLAAARVHLTHVLMDDRDVGRDVDAAVLLRGGQAEHVVVLVDGAADRAQGVVAVGEDVGQRELRHARSLGGLNDADKGDVVGRHGIEFDAQVFHRVRLVVGLQDAIGDGAGLRLLFVGRFTGQGFDFRSFRLRHDFRAVHEVDAAVVQFDHLLDLLIKKYLVNV